MAIKNFAIPLNEKSKQSGDGSFEMFTRVGTSVTFSLTYVTAGQTNQLNLVTNKSMKVQAHAYAATVSSGTASVTLTAAQLEEIYADADGGDWDYIQAQWTVGSVDSGGTTNNFQTQGGSTYNVNGWPPV